MIAQPPIVPARANAPDVPLPKQRALARPPVDVDPHRLKVAIANGELELRYQPEVDLRSGQIVALEGLLRWPCPGAGVLEPKDFLSLAHQRGLMTGIDTWVIETAAAQAAEWRDGVGQSRLVWLNVSMASLLDEAFVYRMVGVLDRYAMAPATLGLEVSERVLHLLGKDAKGLLRRLRELGLVLVVDDFSSFDSALGAIAALPVDAVKLDQRFLRSLRSGDQGSRVEAVVSEAHSMGMYVVGEGVETVEEAEWLTEIGCDRAHGFLYGSAQRHDRIGWLLEKGPGWRGELLTDPARSD
ncbi:MAG: domain S-box/diguanylate cyclase protein [Frankiales bacterium]|nr:domain S-box/diguanylate cyclase protein [Frankiales bacterium]